MMILELDKLEMILVLEDKEKGMLCTDTLQLLYPPPNPTIFPIKII